MDSSFLIPGNETPEQAALRKKQAVAQALIGGQSTMPQNTGQGIAALGSALMQRYQQQGSAFPQAPTGSQPNFGASLMNMFSGRQNGGLY